MFFILRRFRTNFCQSLLSKSKFAPKTFRHRALTTRRTLFKKIIEIAFLPFIVHHHHYNVSLQHCCTGCRKLLPQFLSIRRRHKKSVFVSQIVRSASIRCFAPIESLSVWPDLAKLGKMFKAFGYFEYVFSIGQNFEPTLA